MAVFLFVLKDDEKRPAIQRTVIGEMSVDESTNNAETLLAPIGCPARIIYVG